MMDVEKEVAMLLAGMRSLDVRLGARERREGKYMSQRERAEIERLADCAAWLAKRRGYNG